MFTLGHLKMCLIGDKFEYHRIGNNLGIEKHAYKDQNRTIIREKEHIKDLGVHISRDYWHLRHILDIDTELLFHTFLLGEKLRKLRDNSYAWTTCNL